MRETPSDTLKICKNVDLPPLTPKLWSKFVVSYPTQDKEHPRNRSSCLSLPVLKIKTKRS